MKRDEIEALRKAADDVWEIARRLDKLGFTEAAEVVKDSTTLIHDRARAASKALRAKK